MGRQFCFSSAVRVEYIHVGKLGGLSGVKDVHIKSKRNDEPKRKQASSNQPASHVSMLGRSNGPGSGFLWHAPVSFSFLSVLVSIRFPLSSSSSLFFTRYCSLVVGFVMLASRPSVRRNSFYCSPPAASRLTTNHAASSTTKKKSLHPSSYQPMRHRPPFPSSPPTAPPGIICTQRDDPRKERGKKRGRGGVHARTPATHQPKCTTPPLNYYLPINDPPPEPKRPRPAAPAASEDLRMWKEHMSVESTDIMAPALSNSPQ